MVTTICLMHFVYRRGSETTAYKVDVVTLNFPSHKLQFPCTQCGMLCSKICQQTASIQMWLG